MLETDIRGVRIKLYENDTVDYKPLFWLIKGIISCPKYYVHNSLLDLTAEATITK